MSQASSPWSAWLDQIPPQERQALAAALTARGDLNGAGKKTAAEETGSQANQGAGRRVPILTPDEAEVFRHLHAPEPFVDVYRLMPLCKMLSYKQNLLFKGPKGIGKTLLVRTFAAEDQAPLITVPCSEETKKLDLFGSLAVIGGETVFVLGGLPLAIEMANKHGKCVLVFEELNALTPQVQKSLNELLDFRQSVTVRQVQKTWSLDSGAKLWACGALNPTVYGGTFDMNEDLKSRFEEIEIDYPPFEAEKQIIKAQLSPDKAYDRVIDLMINFTKETRTGAVGYALSPRDVVRTVKNVMLLADGKTDPASIDQALKIALQMTLCKFEGEDRKTAKVSAQRVFPNAGALKDRWEGQ